MVVIHILKLWIYPVSSNSVLIFWSTHPSSLIISMMLHLESSSNAYCLWLCTMNQAWLVAHTCTNDARGVLYDNDAVWVRVPGSFTRGNLGGRLIILNFFSEFWFTEYIMASSTMWRSNCNPQSLRTKSPRATSVFSAHLHKLSLLIHKITKRMIPVRISKVSVQRMTTNLKMTLKTLKMERKTEISLRMVGTPVVLTNHRPVTRSLPSTSTKERMEYSESDSDLGNDEERILLHDDHNIPSDDGDESTPKCKLNLSDSAQHSSSRKSWWKDWIKLI